MASRHAQMPVPLPLADGRMRVYFSARDEENRSRSGFFETAAAQPSKVAYVHDRPVLELGKPGAFDDRGAMASCIVPTRGDHYLYYIGFTRGTDAPYKSEVGLAVSTDGGITFSRAQTAPILDRAPAEPLGTNSPFVRRDAGLWKMWFGSFTGWERTGQRAEPVYVIRYAESSDGVRWRRVGGDCIEPESDGEVNARAWVLGGDDAYRMWFSYRASLDFRGNRDRSYRIGYAESRDGRRWERRDEVAGLGPSEVGWDSEMAAYGCVYDHAGATHLLYNGNGFGRSGIGHAIAA